MKKYYIIASLTLALFCCGCSKQTTPEQTTKQTTTENNATTERTDTLTNLPEELTFSVNNCDFVLTKIDAGTFQMGSYEGIGEDDELPVRNITITKDFYMGIYEVTQAQWKAVMGDNPSGFQGDSLPVETITWAQANEFCQKLSTKSGYRVTLPTEAQWEYACRGSSTEKWFFGDNEELYGTYATTDLEAKTMAVGSFAPNPNGLYDMYGNVMEWCLDFYGDKYPEDDLTDPTGCESGDARISRGGGWGQGLDSCRSSYRNACGEDIATDGIGLRIVIHPE